MGRSATATRLVVALVVGVVVSALLVPPAAAGPTSDEAKRINAQWGQGSAEINSAEGATDAAAKAASAIERMFAPPPRTEIGFELAQVYAQWLLAQALHKACGELPQKFPTPGMVFGPFLQCISAVNAEVLALRDQSSALFTEALTGEESPPLSRERQRHARLIATGSKGASTVLNVLAAGEELSGVVDLGKLKNPRAALAKARRAEQVIDDALDAILRDGISGPVTARYHIGRVERTAAEVASTVYFGVIPDLSTAVGLSQGEMPALTNVGLLREEAAVLAHEIRRGIVGADSAEHEARYADDASTDRSRSAGTHSRAALASPTATADRVTALYDTLVWDVEMPALAILAEEGDLGEELFAYLQQTRPVLTGAHGSAMAAATVLHLAGPDADLGAAGARLRQPDPTTLLFPALPARGTLEVTGPPAVVKAGTTWSLSASVRGDGGDVTERTSFLVSSRSAGVRLDESGALRADWVAEPFANVPEIAWVWAFGPDGTWGARQVVVVDTDDDGDLLGTSWERGHGFDPRVYDDPLATLAGAPAPESGGEQPVDGARPGFDSDPATIDTIDEADAVEAAIAIARERFADATAPSGGGGSTGGRSAAYAVLSRDDDFPDSLAAAGLSADGPLLFTDRLALTTSTRSELQRVLAPGGRVYLLGGPAAIGDAVETELRGLGYAPTRLAGPSRVETSLAIADEVRALRGGTRVALARAYPAGESSSAWADSVTGGAWAAEAGVPIIVTPSSELHPAAADWLARTTPFETVLLGGEAALSNAVLTAVPSPRRVSGPERTATAAEIARQLWGADASGPRRFVIIDAGHPRGWMFGLAAGGLAADADAPVLMVTATEVPQPTRDLVSSPIEEVDLVVVGDSSVVPGPLREQLEALDG